MMIEFQVNVWDKGFNHISVIKSRVREAEEARGMVDFSFCRKIENLQF